MNGVTAASQRADLVFILMCRDAVRPNQKSFNKPETDYT